MSADETPECDRSNPTFRDCKLVLVNFALGAYEHPHVGWFAKEVAESIRSYEKQAGGIPVRKITIQGFADGYHNGGIDGWEKIKGVCGENRKGRLNDIDLARVRGCLVKEAILKELGDSLLVSNKPFEDAQPQDYEDGVNKGGEFRKVEVTFKIIGE